MATDRYNNAPVLASRDGETVLPEERIPLRVGDGGGTSDGMETRVIRLEEWSKVASDRLGRIETKLDALPSKGDMIQLFLAMFVVLGLLFAGLAWLDSRAGRYAKEQATAPSAPIVIQVPSPPPPVAPPAAKK